MLATEGSMGSVEPGTQPWPVELLSPPRSRVVPLLCFFLEAELAALCMTATSCPSSAWSQGALVLAKPQGHPQMLQAVLTGARRCSDWLCFSATACGPQVSLFQSNYFKHLKAHFIVM